MVHPPQRTALTGPALVRLLARIAETDAQASQQPLADRLSQWLGWTDAIALSTVLSAPAPAVGGLAGNPVRADGDDEAQRCLSLRSALSRAIVTDGVLAPPRHNASHARHARTQPVPDLPEMPADYTLFRQSYLALQQKMEADIGDLRTLLRNRLAAQSSAMAKLAALDAVMERSLAARERTLLGTVPGLLGKYFERLRKAAQAAEAVAQAQQDGAAQAQTDSKDSTSGAWLTTFRKDMQSLLLAELDVRFQPVEGLLAALRTR
ncbi:hypothetical protein F4827_005665 [Paraburkholderia bannensis]|uniref:DUF3348 domain-containing protein n=1 Tax=Paraburkholderia bannensis TaxID=765414 RepID=A0A7W9WTY7_9BURK|nr:MULTISPECIES: DUF3348 domain-containing protein [Paraburkholderia]MBB3260625.1 hypothetical protein [Paraburkholderia sp. WP4_3_2]MBB6105795.1 hypothetical protein [Paraburkholderia bannensis]